MSKPPFFHIFILTAFIANTLAPVAIVQAQEFKLPTPGVMVALSPPMEAPLLKGIKVHLNDPFRFDFILDKGDSSFKNMSSPNALVGHPEQEQLKTDSTRLIKYFLAGLTIPEKDLWVNLSPYEKERIIPKSFGLTVMGRDLLAEDYMLKQITASLIYPEDKVGKEFWKRIYAEAYKRYGTTNITVNTFNKVWIVPKKADIYENPQAGTAYVVESKLKVMLEEDYLAMLKHQGQPGDMASAVSPSRLPNDTGLNAKASQGNNQSTNSLGSQVLREIVIPELNKEVNEGKNFTQLRQVYNSLILAIWYKTKIKDSILSQVYSDKKKVAGVGYKNSLSSPNVLVGDPEYIYQQYLKAFKKGVYNYIKEDFDPSNQETVPRKYFSGGVGFNPGNGRTSLGISQIMKRVSGDLVKNPPSDRAMQVTVEMTSEKFSDHAMLSKDNQLKSSDILKAYEQGVLNGPIPGEKDEFEGLRDKLIALGVDLKQMDDSIENTGKMTVQALLLQGSNLVQTFGGNHAAVYRGVIGNNRIIVKEFGANELEHFKKYQKFENILGDKAAGYQVFDQLDIKVNGEIKTLHNAVVQEEVETLLEAIHRIKKEYTRQADIQNAINSLLNEYFLAFKEVLHLGLLPPVTGALIDWGVKDGRVLVIDVGDLNEKENWDYKNQFSEEGLYDKFFDEFFYRVLLNGPDRTRMILNFAKVINPVSYAAMTDAQIISYEKWDNSHRISPEDLGKIVQYKIFSDASRELEKDKLIKILSFSPAFVHRVVYFGDKNINQMVKDARLRFIENTLRAVHERGQQKLPLFNPLEDYAMNATTKAKDIALIYSEGLAGLRYLFVFGLPENKKFLNYNEFFYTIEAVDKNGVYKEIGSIMFDVLGVKPTDKYHGIDITGFRTSSSKLVFSGALGNFFDVIKRHIFPGAKATVLTQDPFVIYQLNGERIKHPGIYLLNELDSAQLAQIDKAKETGSGKFNYQQLMEQGYVKFKLGKKNLLFIKRELETRGIVYFWIDVFDLSGKNKIKAAQIYFSLNRSKALAKLDSYKLFKGKEDRKLLKLLREEQINPDFLDMNISTNALEVQNSYQDKGIGRILLAISMQMAKKKGGIRFRILDTTKGYYSKVIGNFYKLRGTYGSVDLADHKFFPLSLIDHSMLTKTPSQALSNHVNKVTGPGGIDLTQTNLNVKEGGIKFHLDVAELALLQNSPGFTPVIINVQPLNDLQQFLGINATKNLHV